MNVLLWILQVALALLCFAGGGFKVSNPGVVAKQAPALPAPAWRLLGLVELLGAALLIIPPAAGWMPSLTLIAAGALAVDNLLLSALYARASLKLAATNPLVFAAPMAVLGGFIAWGRYALAPFGA